MVKRAGLDIQGDVEKPGSDSASEASCSGSVPAPDRFELYVGDDGQLHVRAAPRVTGQTITERLPTWPTSP